MAAVIRFGSECTFFASTDLEETLTNDLQIVPGKLQKGNLFRVYGTDGLFKVVGKLIEKGKLFIEAERLSDELFKVEYHGETFGVEAICRQNGGNCPVDYFVTETKLLYNRKTGDFYSKTVGKWIPALECVRV